MRVLDLCSGAAGGWSLGLHRAGFTTIAACEAVDWRRQMFAHNFPEARLYDDLRTLGADALQRDVGPLPDVIAGSPPCKEYSPVNSRGRGLDGDDLFLHAVRLVDECRPRWFLAENSDRIRHRGYDRIAAALEAIGYTCWPLVVGAGNAGASHRRKRAFIVATDLSRQQGRPARQSRPNGGVGSHSHGARVRLEPRGSGGAGGADQIEPLIARSRLGPVGSADLGRHLREYDGLPARLAERCREAYGDAVLPQLTEAVGRAILQVDAALADMRSAEKSAVPARMSA